MPSAKGSCVCGEYTFEYTGDTYEVCICNCIPCRKYFALSSTNLMTDKKYFKQLSRTEVTAAPRLGDSGKSVTNHCCQKCLATIWVDAEAFRPTMVIKAGLFDDQRFLDKLKPTHENFCENRPKNIAEVPGVEHYARDPPS